MRLARESAHACSDGNEDDSMRRCSSANIPDKLLLQKQTEFPGFFYRETNWRILKRGRKR